VQEAGDILSSAWTQFPFQPELAAYAADYAKAAGNWDEAFRIWNEVMRRFPAEWIGYQGHIQTLTAGGRHAEADEFLSRHASDFSSDVNAMHDFAQLAERQGDWAEAERRWRSLIAMPQSKAWHHLRLFRTLQNQGRFSEAGEVLLDGARRFPEDSDIALEASLRGQQLHA
jgi:predicted Zn-dependent protease